jgi:hypothetical protein
MTERGAGEPLDDLLHDDEPHDAASDLEAVANAANAATRRDRGGRKGRLLLAAGTLLIAITGTVMAMRPEWFPVDLPNTPSTPTATPDGPALKRDTPLRSAPREDASLLIRLEARTKLRVVGKSPDGAWVAAAAVDRPDLVGWLASDSVEGIDLAGIGIVTADPSAAATRTVPAGPSDLPDLRIESAYVKDNRLYVSVLNLGPADLRGTLMASVDGGPAAPIEGKSDEGLRAGQRIQASVRGVYVQIRGAVNVTITTSPSVAEIDIANNTFSGIVEPDQPTDLEISSVERTATALVVTVRNRSSIPISGIYTVTVREPLPGTRLLGRLEQSGTIEPNGTIAIPFADLRDVDMSRIAVNLSTDAISDAVLGNNTYPR